MADNDPQDPPTNPPGSDPGPEPRPDPVPAFSAEEIKGFARNLATGLDQLGCRAWMFGLHLQGAAQKLRGLAATLAAFVAE